VPSRNRRSSRLTPRADWLGREHSARRRSWALEEQLLGTARHAERDERRLRTLAGQLSEERVALAQMEAELREQLRWVMELEHQLEAVARQSVDGLDSGPMAPTNDHRASPRTVVLRSPNSPPDRDYWLSRCEGFLVESPKGAVGVVDGVRFGSRIDRPDLIEVEFGRLRRRMLLIPVEEVEDVCGDEERVTLSHDPRSHPYRGLVHDLLPRVRGRARISPS
jgi:hypothetical protein